MACLGSAGSLWLLGGGWAVEWGDPGGRGGWDSGVSAQAEGAAVAIVRRGQIRDVAGRRGHTGGHEAGVQPGRGAQWGGRGGEACALNARLCLQQCFSGLLRNTDACRWASRGPSTRGKEEALSRLPRVEHGAWWKEPDTKGCILRDSVHVKCPGAESGFAAVRAGAGEAGGTQARSERCRFLSEAAEMF